MGQKETDESSWAFNDFRSIGYRHAEKPRLEIQLNSNNPEETECPNKNTLLIKYLKQTVENDGEERCVTPKSDHHFQSDAGTSTCDKKTKEIKVECSSVHCGTDVVNSYKEYMHNIDDRKTMIGRRNIKDVQKMKKHDAQSEQM